MTAPARRRGNAFGFAFFHLLTRLAGLRGAYGFLHFVCAYYLLFDRPAVRAAQAYLRRRFAGASAAARELLAYRLFLSQGRALVDRHAGLHRPELFQYEFPTLGRLQERLAGTRGAILLLAHVGNWQLALGALPRLGRTVTLVMRPEDNPAVAASLRVNPDESGLRVLSVDADAAGAVEILRRIDAGEIVCLMADRSYAFRSAAVRFLGDTAQMPIGPYQVARAAQCPVFLLLTHRAGHRRYRIEMDELPAPEPAGGRAAQLTAWAQAFADRLADYAAAHPLQVFLFHDVWAPPAGLAFDRAEGDALSIARGPTQAGARAGSTSGEAT